MTTRRLLDTKLANQFSIALDTDITMGYATNDQTNSLSTIHNLNGSWTLNLPSNGSSSGGSGGGGSTGEDGETVEAEDGETVEAEDGETVEAEDGETVEAEDGETVEAKVGFSARKLFRLSACPTPLPSTN